MIVAEQKPIEKILEILPDRPVEGRGGHGALGGQLEAAIIQEHVLPLFLSRIVGGYSAVSAGVRQVIVEIVQRFSVRGMRNRRPGRPASKGIEAGFWYRC